jgi:hypothetical protein
MTEIANFPYMDREVIRLTAEGVWLADGEEITHERTVSAFQRNLVPEEGGPGWEIRIGRERKKIEVDDTAFFVRKVEGTPDHGFRLFLTDGTVQELDPKTLQYRPGRLTCEIRWQRELSAASEKNQGSSGRAEARFLRAPYLEILSYVTQKDGRYWLTLAGITLELKEGSS